MLDRDELLAREAMSWDAFQAAVGRVAPQDRDLPEALERWSVKDLVWHCAYWADFCAAALEQRGDGPFVDPFEDQDDAVWDAENARIAEASAEMSWQEVTDGAVAARARARAALGPVVDEGAAGLFADETSTHFDEHAAHIEAFAERRARP
jgi:hypothetical protein